MTAPVRQRHYPPADPPQPPRPRSRLAGSAAWPRLLDLVGVVAAAVLLLLWLAPPAVAQAADPTLGQVIDRLRTVLVGLLVGLATLLLTVGGVRYLLAGGDPGQVEKAKITLRSAAIGYGLAVLAPGLVRLLRYVVGS
jgi:Type IV secretion system pilin